MSGKVKFFSFGVRGIYSCIWKAFRFAVSGVRDGTCTCTRFRKYRGVGNADEITFVLYKRGKIVSPYLLRRTLSTLITSSLYSTIQDYIISLLYSSDLWLWDDAVASSSPIYRQVVSDHIVTISHACRWWGIIKISSQFRRPHTPFLLYLIQVSICFCSWM